MLTPDDFVTIAPAAADLVAELSAALHKEGPGGGKVTKAEGRKLLAKARRLVDVLVRDIID